MEASVKGPAKGELGSAYALLTVENRTKKAVPRREGEEEEGRRRGGRRRGGGEGGGVRQNALTDLGPESVEGFDPSYMRRDFLPEYFNT